MAMSVLELKQNTPETFLLATILFVSVKIKINSGLHSIKNDEKSSFSCYCFFFENLETIVRNKVFKKFFFRG